MEEQPVEGQIRGVGLRLDPQGILIAPHEKDGLQWGYTIIDKSRAPSMYINDEWVEVVPAGVWLQMLENWEGISNTAKEIFANYPEYLEYPEIKDLILTN